MTCYPCWRDANEEFENTVEQIGTAAACALLDPPGEEPDDDEQLYCDWHFEDACRLAAKRDRDARDAVRGDRAKAMYYHKKYGDPL